MRLSTKKITKVKFYFTNFTKNYETSRRRIKENNNPPA